MNALSPAKVQRVTIVDDKEKVMEVVVEDSQLSLAIGKKGQNVRLAAKLTGWRIDIKSEEEKRREVEAQFEGLETVSEGGEADAGEPTETTESTEITEAPSAESEVTPLPYTLAGVGDKTVRKLVDAGFATREVVADATIEAISEIPGIGEKTAEKILTAARGEAQESTDASKDEGSHDE